MTAYLAASSVGAFIATAILALDESHYDLSALLAILLALWAIASAIRETHKEAQP